MNEIDENKMPELGSPEAAVQAAVNLLAAVTKLDERKLAYWLDMYYQLRSHYEAEKAHALFFAPALPDDTEDARDQTGDGSADEAAPQEADVTAPEVQDGGEVSPVPGSPAAKAAQEKRRIRERFMQARTNGVALGAIRKAANGSIKEESLRDIIESNPVPVAVYRVLDKALDHLEQ